MKIDKINNNTIFVYDKQVTFMQAQKLSSIGVCMNCNSNGKLLVQIKTNKPVTDEDITKVRQVFS